jgi:fatty-acyl-CoA synthase
VLSQHADVAMVAVVGVPDEKWGEAVTAVIVARPGARPDADELINLVKAGRVRRTHPNISSSSPSCR